MSKITLIVTVIVPKVLGQKSGSYHSLPVEIEIDSETKSSKILNPQPECCGWVRVSEDGYHIEVATKEEQVAREQQMEEDLAATERYYQEEEKRQEALRGERIARRLARARRRQERNAQA